MYLCICNEVTESEVIEAIQSGSVTLAALQDKLGIASQCGQCTDEILALLTTLLQKHNRHSSSYEKHKV